MYMLIENSANWSKFTIMVLFQIFLIGIFGAQAAARERLPQWLEQRDAQRRTSDITDPFLRNVIESQLLYCPFMDLCYRRKLSLKVYYETCCEDSCSCDEKDNQTVYKCVDVPNVFQKRCMHTHFKSDTLQSVNVPEYQLIAKCSSTNNFSNFNILCDPSTIDLYGIFALNLSIHRPVTNILTNSSYRNLYCALCNGEDQYNLHGWHARLTCEHPIFTQDTESFLQMVYNTSCDIIFEPRGFELSVMPCKDPQITACNMIGIEAEYDELRDRACRAYTSPFQKIYKNVFCYHCNHYSDYDTPNQCSTRDLPNYVNETYNEQSFFEVAPFFVEKRRGICLENQEWDLIMNVCHDILCPFGFAANKYQCLPMYMEIEHFSYQLLISLNITLQKEDNCCSEDAFEEIKQMLSKNVSMSLLLNEERLRICSFSTLMPFTKPSLVSSLRYMFFLNLEINGYHKPLEFMQMIIQMFTFKSVPIQILSRTSGALSMWVEDPDRYIFNDNQLFDRRSRKQVGEMVSILGLDSDNCLNSTPPVAVFKGIEQALLLLTKPVVNFSYINETNQICMDHVDICFFDFYYGEIEDKALISAKLYLSNLKRLGIFISYITPNIFPNLRSILIISFTFIPVSVGLFSNLNGIMKKSENIFNKMFLIHMSLFFILNSIFLSFILLKYDTIFCVVLLCFVIALLVSKTGCLLCLSLNVFRNQNKTNKKDLSIYSFSHLLFEFLLACLILPIITLAGIILWVVLTYDDLPNACIDLSPKAFIYSATIPLSVIHFFTLVIIISLIVQCLRGLDRSNVLYIILMFLGEVVVTTFSSLNIIWKSFHYAILVESGNILESGVLAMAGLMFLIRRQPNTENSDRGAEDTQVSTNITEKTSEAEIHSGFESDDSENESKENEIKYNTHM